MGINTISIGITSTPAISNVLQNNKFCLGIMITASHDPNQNNGIKLFAGNGFKLDKESEKIIEKIINRDLSKVEQISSSILGESNVRDDLVNHYTQSINNKLNKININKKILIDCSNGGYSSLINKINFNKIKPVIINNKPDGNNINLDCGSLEINKLIKEVNNANCDYGAAFDGDGDRIIFVHKDYGQIHTEKLLIMFSFLFNNNTKTVVSSIICNKGLEINCKKYNLNLIQTDVGDRLVVNSAYKNKAIIGAEPSGHFCFPNETATMDGLLTLIKFFQILEKFDSDFKPLFDELLHFNRLSYNINKSDQNKINTDEINNSLNAIINHDEEKVIVRESMWDPVYRIYYDYKSKDNFYKIKELLTKTFSLNIKE
jgi:phosphoglucosamine mutase